MRSWVGNRFQIIGMRNNASGILKVLVDDQEPYEGNLYQDNVGCSLFVDYYLGNGTHDVTILLTGKSDNVTEGSSYSPVLHLTEIMYAKVIMSCTSQEC